MQQHRQDEPEGLTVQIIHCLAMHLPNDGRLGMHTTMDMHCVSYKGSCDASYTSQARCMTHTAVELVSHTHIVDAYPGSYLRRAARPFQQRSTPSQPYITHYAPTQV